MQLDIISPDKTLFDGTVKAVQLPGIDGSFQLLERHAPLVSVLGKGAIVVETQSTEKITFNIDKGLVEVKNNKVSVLLY